MVDVLLAEALFARVRVADDGPSRQNFPRLRNLAHLLIEVAVVNVAFKDGSIMVVVAACSFIDLMPV